MSSLPAGFQLVGGVDDPAQPQGAANPRALGPGLKTAIAAPLVSAARAGAEAAFTSPTLPATMARIGRVAGAVAPVVGGAVEGGPVGAMVGMAAASKGAWAGGKTGWFSGKMVQDMAEPVAKVAAKVEPYAQTLSTLSGVQSLLDLAQIADPSRKDIGVLGVGINPPRSDAEKAAHPALINAMADAFIRSAKNSPQTWANVVQAIKDRVVSK